MNAALFLLAFGSPAAFLALMLGLKETRERPVLKALSLGLCAGIAFYGMRCDATTDIYRHMALLSAYDTTFSVASTLVTTVACSYGTRGAGPSKR